MFHLSVQGRIDRIRIPSVLTLLSKQCIVGVLIIVTSAARGIGDEPQPTLLAGPEIGSTISSFYVRAITGPQAGKSVCYVCRNGDRPVVMVFLREIDADSARLLKQLDAAVNQHRAEGLRCFVVLFSETSQRDSARLQTLAFDEKLTIPLTLATESLAGSTSKQIAPNAAVTVVLYDHLKVIERFSYRTGECTDKACEAVLNSAVKLANDASQSPTTKTE